MEPEERKDVHTEHCCQRHGCKYADLNCTVITHIKNDSGVTIEHRYPKQQSFPCEFCMDALQGDEYYEAYELNEMYDRGFAAGHDDMHSQVMS